MNRLSEEKWVIVYPPSFIKQSPYICSEFRIPVSFSKFIIFSWVQKLWTFPPHFFQTSIHEHRSWLVRHQWKTEETLHREVATPNERNKKDNKRIKKAKQIEHCQRDVEVPAGVSSFLAEKATALSIAFFSCFEKFPEIHLYNSLDGSSPNRDKWAASVCVTCPSERNFRRASNRLQLLSSKKKCSSVFDFFHCLSHFFI